MQNAFWQKWAVIATKFIWVSKCLFVHMMHHCVGTLCNWKEWLWTCDIILRFQFSKIGIWLGRMKLKSNNITFIIRMMDPWISSDIKKTKTFQSVVFLFSWSIFLWFTFEAHERQKNFNLLDLFSKLFQFCPRIPRTIKRSTGAKFHLSDSKCFKIKQKSNCIIVSPLFNNVKNGFMLYICNLKFTIIPIDVLSQHRTLT